MRAIPALLAAAIVTSLAAAPQDQAPTLEAWLGAIEQHTPGERDAPARLVGAWSRGDLGGLVPQLTRHARQRNNPKWLAVTLERAALFHADIAMLNRVTGGYSLPPDGRYVVQFRDGRQVGYGAETFHWGFGRLLLTLLPPQAAADDYARRWYHATSAFLQYWRDYAELKPHLSQAHALFPDDARLWLYDATLHEYFAEPEVQHVAAKVNDEQQKEAAVNPPNRLGASTQSVTKPAPLVEDASSERAAAEAFLRKALKLDPSLAEARLRLGRILGLRTQHANAAAELKRALADAKDDVLRYYALLFLGQSQQALGQRVDAQRAYEQAAALFSGAQSPRLALSVLAHDTGDRAAAVAALDLLGKPGARATREDPWWVYFFTHVPDCETLVEGLRKTDFGRFGVPGFQVSGFPVRVRVPGFDAPTFPDARPISYSVSTSNRQRLNLELRNPEPGTRTRTGNPETWNPGTRDQIFSARVDSVRVDVLVSDGRQPVVGLQAADFEVLDNGVAQKIDLVSFEQLPLNVVLALDLSDSVAGDRLTHLQQAGRAVVDALRPEDAVGLVTFSDAVIVRTALTHERARARDALVAPAETGQTSLIDASYAAMALGGADIGRALVIVFSDGADTSSFLKPDSVIATARRSEAVVYAVSVGESGSEKFLGDLAEATGGRQLSVESTRRLSETLLSILDEFRHRYLVSFTPMGVTKDGWHRLEVKVKNRRVLVRARAGYQAR